MLINFVDAINDANHYTKPPPFHVHQRAEIPCKSAQFAGLTSCCCMHCASKLHYKYTIHRQRNSKNFQGRRLIPLNRPHNL